MAPRDGFEPPAKRLTVACSNADYPGGPSDEWVETTPNKEWTIAFKTLLNRDAYVVVSSINKNRSGVSQSFSSDPKLQVLKTEVINRPWSRQKKSARHADLCLTFCVVP